MTSCIARKSEVTMPKRNRKGALWIEMYFLIHSETLVGCFGMISNYALNSASQGDTVIFAECDGLWVVRKKFLCPLLSSTAPEQVVAVLGRLVGTDFFQEEVGKKWKERLSTAFGGGNDSIVTLTVYVCLPEESVPS